MASRCVSSTNTANIANPDDMLSGNPAAYATFLDAGTFAVCYRPFGSAFQAEGAGLPSVTFAGIAAQNLVVIDDAHVSCRAVLPPRRSPAPGSGNGP